MYAGASLRCYDILVCICIYLRRPVYFFKLHISGASGTRVMYESCRVHYSTKDTTSNKPWGLPDFEDVISARIPSLSVVEIPSEFDDGKKCLATEPIDASEEPIGAGICTHPDFRVGALKGNKGYSACTVRVADVMDWGGGGVVEGESVGRYHGLLRDLMYKIAHDGIGKRKMLEELRHALDVRAGELTEAAESD